MNDDLRIELEGGATSFRPGEAIRGTVSWAQTEPIESVRVCLVWSTEGKGTQDVDVVQEMVIPSSRSADRQGFAVVAPVEGPYSFSGRLVSLVWAIELVIEPGTRASRQNIVIAPTGGEIDLYAGAADESA